MEWFIGIITGLISGIISGLLVTQYFRNKDRIKLIIQYAQKTADYAFEITEEAREYLAEKDPGRLKELLRRSLHRPFDGKIPNDELQEAIANCNQGVSAISNALDRSDRQDLFHASWAMSDRLLDLWNATVNFETKERHKTEKKLENIRGILALIGICFVVGLAIIYS